MPDRIDSDANFGDTEALRALHEWVEKCEAHKLDMNNLLTQAGLLQVPQRGSKPSPHVFEDIQEFNSAIQAVEPILRTYLADKLSSVKDAVWQSVDRNTIRAFHLKSTGSDQKPLNLYRSTLTSYFEEELSNFRRLTCAKDYAEFVVQSARMIENVFDNAAGRRGFMGFGRAAKLFNLTCKSMMRHEQLTDAERDCLMKLLHVPLDSYSLQAIRKLDTPFLIPSNASMGWLKMNDVPAYYQLQDWIRLKCAAVNVYPIHFEIAAWDQAH